MSEPDCEHGYIKRKKKKGWRCVDCDWPFVPKTPTTCDWVHFSMDSQTIISKCDLNAEWMVEIGDDPDPRFRCDEHVVEILSRNDGITNHVIPYDETLLKEKGK